MAWLPYHHDWRLVHEANLGVRLHWFDRFAGTPDWKVEPSRLAADMVSFFFVERNTCWAVVNGRRWELGPGDLLVVKGGDAFSFGHDPARPHFSLSVSLAFEEGGRANALLYRKFRRRYVWPDPEEYVREFEKVRAALASDSPFRELRINGALFQWLAFVMDRLRPPRGGAYLEERGVVEKILEAETWAHARLAEVITLPAWARAVGLHPVYFGRVFKRETGLRPMAWLNERRLQLACQLLAGTAKNVTEIAEACGFASPFYFSRVFRRHFGQPPVSYRRTQA
ncbi:MAG: helix-turn-helix transcriptional regulator [Verrucomicrobia bacterium]|nr:helix-turn-helix transcriptional regulator [Verrucomicrobiota bacterium]